MARHWRILFCGGGCLQHQTLQRTSSSSQSITMPRRIQATCADIPPREKAVAAGLARGMTGDKHHNHVARNNELLNRILHMLPNRLTQKR